MHRITYYSFHQFNLHCRTSKRTWLQHMRITKDICTSNPHLRLLQAPPRNCLGNCTRYIGYSACTYNHGVSMVACNPQKLTPKDRPSRRKAHQSRHRVALQCLYASLKHRQSPVLHEVSYVLRVSGESRPYR